MAQRRRVRCGGQVFGVDFSQDLERLITVVTIAAVFVPLELLRPSHRRPGFSWRRTLTDLSHVVIGGLMIRIASVAVMASAVAFAQDRLGLHGNAAALPLWAQIPLVIVLSDFMLYLGHRMFHAVPALWEFHKIHHSSNHLDWLATYRVHPVDQVVTASMIALPAVLLGFSYTAILVYLLVFQWHSILLHSNVRASFGPLNRVLTTPWYHHWHHANETEAYDRNFAGQLKIWDRLFGTAFEPAGRVPERFGVDEAPGESFAEHIIHPFVARPMLAIRKIPARSIHGKP